MKQLRSPGIVAVTALIGLIGASCQDGPTQPGPGDAEPPLSYKPGNGGGGGGGPPSTTTTSVVFRAFYDNFDIDNRFVADHNSTYVDGQEKVVATLENQFVLTPHGGKGKPIADPREICLDFSDQVSGSGLPWLPLFGTQVCVHGDFRTVWSNLEGGLEAMADGQTIAEARIIFHINDGSGNEYKVAYFCPDERQNPSCPNLVTVTRDGNSWTLEFFAGQDAELSFVGGAVIGAFHVPFKMTVTKE